MILFPYKMRKLFPPWDCFDPTVGTYVICLRDLGRVGQGSLYTLILKREERPAIEIAAHEVAEHLTEIDDEHLRLQQLVGRRHEEIEGIGDGVGKAAEDEHRQAHKGSDPLCEYSHTGNTY